MTTHASVTAKQVGQTIAINLSVNQANAPVVVNHTTPTLFDENEWNAWQSRSNDGITNALNISFV